MYSSRSLLTLATAIVATTHCTLLPISALSQPPQEQWIRNFGGEGDDVPYGVCETGDGSFIVVGSTTSFDGIGRDIYMVKLDAQGATMWQRVYDFGYNETATDIQAVNDSQYVVVGHRQGGGFYWQRAIFSMFIDTEGDTISLREYSYRPGQFPTRVCPNDSGLIFVGAAVNSNDYGWYALSVDHDGDSLWSTLGMGSSGGVVNGTGYFSDADVQPAIGSVAIAAFSGAELPPHGPPNPIRMSRIMRFDSEGQTLWDRGGTGEPLRSTLASRVILRDDGSITWMIRPSSGGARFLHYDQNGDTIVTQTVADSVIDLAQGVGGGWVTTSQCWGNDRDIRFTGYDNAGSPVFTTVITGLENETPIRIEPTSDSAYVILGTIDYPFGLRNMWVIKTEPVISLRADHGSVAIPSSFILSVYPNPFNAAAEIRFDLPAASQVKLSVFDLLGREVVEVADETLAAGSYTRRFDAGHLPSGIYVCHLEAGTRRQSRKLVLLK